MLHVVVLVPFHLLKIGHPWRGDGGVVLGLERCCGYVVLHSGREAMGPHDVRGRDGCFEMPVLGYEVAARFSQVSVGVRPFGVPNGPVAQTALEGHHACLPERCFFLPWSRRNDF